FDAPLTPEQLASLPIIQVADWDTAAPAPAPADQLQLWALHAPLPLEPVLPAPAPVPAPVPAPAPAVIAAPAPDPLAPVDGVALPQPAVDVANQAVAGQLPVPAEGMPHLISPENLPPGATLDPGTAPNQPNVSYLRQIWNAVQDQQITGKDALIAVATQRSLTGEVPAQVPGPNVPLTPGAVPPPPAPGAPVLPAPLPAP
ncbi:MAG: transglycosylase family protein, partial [Mycobacterium sp.]